MWRDIEIMLYKCAVMNVPCHFCLIQMTKKLSGHAKGTALWLTSVSNEVGEILISVVTAQEGPALNQMAAGLVQRYHNAGVAPPELLYVDCDCCKENGGQTKLQERFAGWPDMKVCEYVCSMLDYIGLA